jgi:hypothetical protein
VEGIPPLAVDVHPEGGKGLVWRGRRRRGATWSLAVAVGRRSYGDDGSGRGAHEAPSYGCYALIAEGTGGTVTGVEPRFDTLFMILPVKARNKLSPVRRPKLILTYPTLLV